MEIQKDLCASAPLRDNHPLKSARSLFFRFGTFRAPVWAMIFVWLAFDIYGVVSGEQRVAYWAHLGGLMSGFVLGLVGLHFGWLQLTTYDNRSFYEILRGEHPE